MRSIMKRSVYCLLLSVLSFICMCMMFYAGATAAEKNIILATTTSTQDSGLLDVLIPLFEKKTGYMVKTIAVGSGQAMAMGERGEADVLLVHSPDAEKKFMEKGYGLNRMLVMHNDFIIVGPAADPAKIKGVKSSAEAFKKIAESQSLFISRGDNSGTHAKEKAIWKASWNRVLRNRNGIRRPDLAWGRHWGLQQRKRDIPWQTGEPICPLKRNLVWRYSAREIPCC